MGNNGDNPLGVFPWRPTEEEDTERRASVRPSVRPSTIYRRLMESLPVRTPQRQIVPLRFNAAQEYLWDIVAPLLDARQPIQLIILKARREGVSTFVEALLTAICFFENHTQAMVVAHEAKATQRIWGMSERMVKGSPLRAVGHIKGRTIHFRDSMLELATAGSPEAARSADLTALHNSELAFWKREGALLALRQCLPQEDGSFFVEVDESTANGMADDGEEFYEEWLAAESGDNDFNAVFLPYQKFPAYCDADNSPLPNLKSEEEQLIKDLGLTYGQLRWRRRTIANRCQGNVDKFNQEYPATPEMAFIMSGHPYFSLNDVLWCEPDMERGRRGMMIEHRGRVVCKEDPQGLVRIFRTPQPGHEYVIGADSAMGHDDDSHSQSAAEVLDMATLEQVAEYAGAAPPYKFAKDLALLGRAYNDALLFPEVQSSGGGGGREVVVMLRDTYNYPYIGAWLGANDRMRPHPPTLLGWETTARTKPMLLSRVQEVILERSTTIHSRALLKQLRSFGRSDSGAMEALAGHDDLFMAFGIALMGRFQNYIATPRRHLQQATELPWAAIQRTTQRAPEDRDRTAVEEVLAGYGQQRREPTNLMEW